MHQMQVDLVILRIWIRKDTEVLIEGDTAAQQVSGSD